MKSLFILSSNAGVGRPLEYQDMVYDTWKAAGRDHELIVEITSKPGDTSWFAKRFADEYGADGIVYILGGDGSFGEVAGALVGTNTPVGFIPAGTANDLSRVLYRPVPKQIEARRDFIGDLIRKTLTPSLGAMDIIEFTSDDPNHSHAYSINILSFGMDSQILSDALDNLKVFPRAANLCYNLAVATNLARIRSFHLTYEIDLEENGVLSSRTYNQEISLSAVCNGGYYGGGFNPSPEPDLKDGFAEVLIAQGVGRLRFAKLASELKAGQHLKYPEFTYLKNVVGGRLTYHATKRSPRVPANYDGTLFSFTELEFKLLKGGLKTAYLA